MDNDRNTNDIITAAGFRARGRYMQLREAAARARGMSEDEALINYFRWHREALAFARGARRDLRKALRRSLATRNARQISLAL